MGRPPLNREAFAKKATEILAKSKTEEHVIMQLGISKDTYYRWKRDDKDFAEAIEMGKSMAKARNFDLLEAAAFNQIEVNNKALEHWLRWQHPDKFDKKVEVGGTYNQNISIENMNVLNELQKQSASEILEHLYDSAEEMEELQDIIDIEAIEDGSKKQD